MRIEGPSGDALKIYREQLDRKARAEDRRPAAEQSSTLEISEDARDLQVYLARLKELPEAREQLVEQIRRQIDAGTYRVDAARIARGIISEALLDRRV